MRRKPPVFWLILVLGCGGATSPTNPSSDGSKEDERRQTSIAASEKPLPVPETTWRVLDVVEPVRAFSRPGNRPWFIAGFRPSSLYQLDPSSEAQPVDQLELVGDWVTAGASLQDGTFLYANAMNLMKPYLVTHHGRRHSEPMALPVDAGGTISEVLALDDGGALLVGNHNPVTRGELNGWAVRVDAQGKVVWHKRVGRGAYHFFRSAVRLGDGGFRLLGGKERDGGYNGWSARLGKDGDVDQENVYQADLSGGFSTAAAGPSDRVYAIGVATEKKPLVRGKGDAFIAVLDAQGREVLRRDTRAEVSNVVAVGSATVDETGGLWFLAATQVGEPGPQSPEPEGQTWLVHLATEDGEFELYPTEGKSVMLSNSAMAEFIVSATPKGATLIQLHKVGEGRLSWRMHHVGP